MANDVERMFEDYLAAWSSHDVEKIASFFTDDCVYEDVAVGAVNRGKEELKAFASALFAGVPDLKFELKSVFVAGDRAGDEWIMTGTQTGALPGIPATGKSFSIRGASIIELHEGKITRNADYWDLASLLRQLGLMPGAPSG